MSDGNVRNISEIFASIESLNEEADRLNREDEHEVNALDGDSLPVSLVAEMSARKADVVLLDDVYRKGRTSQEHNATSPALSAQQKTNSWPSPGSKSKSSDVEFDQMLSALMKDMEHQSKKGDSIRGPRLSATAQTGTCESDELRDLKANIDGLLSPYLNTPAATPMPQQMTASKFPNHQNSEKQGQSQQRDRHKDLSDAPLSLAIMTDDMRAEIADYILAEIKQQISVWIAQNLDKIVEDALRSLPTEARDASGARSAG